jgi:hypothetical protein
MRYDQQVMQFNTGNVLRLGMQFVRRVAEYEQHADECRKMAAKITDPNHRKQLKDMAQRWLILARTREKQLEKQVKSFPSIASHH